MSRRFIHCVFCYWKTQFRLAQSRCFSFLSGRHSLRSVLYLKNSVFTHGIPLLSAASLSIFSFGDDGEVFLESTSRARISPANSLFAAARDNDVAKIDKLIQSGADANQRHVLGWTPLHVAAFHGCTEAVVALLKGGAQIDSLDNFSTVPEIAKAQKSSVMEVLFARQEEFSSRLRSSSNYSGSTPLHYALLADNLETVQALMDRGADPSLTNDSGHLAVDYARDPDTKQMMEEYAVKFKEERKRRDMEERVRYPLEQRLREHVIGQEGAIALVASTIRRKQNGWYDDEHPLVFLFLGSSGIGKTELAKQVARYLHRGDERAFVRIDMSEYQHKHEVAKFIGAPPGYIGHDEGGQLTRRLRARPDAVVLLDEVEKAHTDILTVLLQLFDEGRLTDGQGQTIECRDAVFIMTSNLVADEIASYGMKLREEGARMLEQRCSDDAKGACVDAEPKVSRQFKEEVVRPILKRHFKRDEFLGRITEFVYFLPFSGAELEQLVARELEAWRKRAQRQHSVALAWEHPLLALLARGYDVHYGARSIKHEVERRVVSRLAAEYEKQTIRAGCQVRILVDPDDSIRFEVTDANKDKHPNRPTLTDRLRRAIVKS